ncbi:hypothetical protein ABBQ32_004852 [Trebouxia sp. C0010 RCD-2024]
MASAGVAETCALAGCHRQLPKCQPGRHALPNRLPRRRAQHPAVDTCKGCRQRRQLCLQGLESPGPSGDEPVDIDQLARRLSQEAEKARQRESDDTVSEDTAEGGVLAAELAQAAREAGAQRPVESSSPFGYETAAREAEILAEVGEGGFAAQEFELVEQIGQLSWVTETQSEDPLSLGQQRTAEQTAIIAFTARYHSNLPFQDPQPTLLKEFLPGARSLGCNEMQLLNHLYTMPTHKWKAAYAALSADPPIVPLLGYFMAGQSETGAKVSNSKSPPEGTLWLVYKWEALMPLSQYPHAQQSAGGRLFGTNQEAALRSRCRMLRSIMRGTLQALAFCHSRNVSHGSMGSGSVLLSTFDDRRANDLIVKLDNFGFGRAHYACSLDLKGDNDRCEQGAALFPGPKPLDADHPLMLAQKEDLQALGGVFLELIFSSLGSAGPSDSTSGPALQRLLVDVFKGNIDEFRRYCNQEPDWTDAMLLLDQWDGAGWNLIRDLAAGALSASELVDNEFCRV